MNAWSARVERMPTPAECWAEELINAWNSVASRDGHAPFFTVGSDAGDGNPTITGRINASNDTYWLCCSQDSFLGPQ